MRLRLHVYVCVLAVLSAGCSRAGFRRDRRWGGAWQGSPQPPAPPLQVAGQPRRRLVRVSLGGERVRVRLSNAHGTTPLVIGAAHLAFSRAAAAIVTGSDRALTFGGAAGVTIAPGALVVSDALPLPVAASSDLVVS